MIRIGLTQVHLPKLADMGFIEWNQETSEISKGPDWDEIAPLLQLMHDHWDELSESWLPERTGDEKCVDVGTDELTGTEP